VYQRHLYDLLIAGLVICSASLEIGASGVASKCLQEQTDKAVLPVMAVVQVAGDDLTPLVALLEDRLSRNESYVLVDREHIDKVLKEQELAALSAARSVAGRMAVGHLLGADLLVLLSKHTTARPYYEVVISETSHGLRLQVSILPIGKEVI